MPGEDIALAGHQTSASRLIFIILTDDRNFLIAMRFIYEFGKFCGGSHRRAAPRTEPHLRTQSGVASFASAYRVQRFAASGTGGFAIACTEIAAHAILHNVFPFFF